MAFASIGTLGSSNSATANQTSATLTTTAAIESGNLAVVIIAVDNHNSGDGDSNEIASVTDSQGAWTKAHEYRNGGASAQTGVTTAVWFKRFSTTLASGSVITATFSAGSSASRDKSAMTAWEFSCGAGVEVEAVNQVLDDGTSATVSINCTTSNIECLRMRCQGAEWNTAGALNTSGWTLFTSNFTTGGSSAANVSVGGEFRISTGTSDASTAYANAAGSDKAILYVALKESAPPNALVGTSSLAFSNTAALSGSGALSGTSAPAFANTAALRGLAPIAGTVTASFAATAAMQAGLAASGVVTISFSNTAALTGTFATSGAGAITVPKQLASGTATRTVPQYAGAGAVAIPVQASAGTATRTVPQYAGAGTVTIPLQAASGAATATAPPQYAGAGAVTIPLQAIAGTGAQAPAGPADFGSLYAWYTAHTNAFMTVNDDGTGGSPSSGGSAGRLTDRGPNGKHLAQSSSPSRPIFRTGKGLNFFWKTAGGHVNASLLNTSISLDAQDTSGGAIFDLPGQNATPLVTLDETSPSNALVIQTALSASPFLGYNYSGVTDKYTTGRKLVVTWRSNGTDLIIRCNGEEFEASAAAAVTLTQLKLGTFAGGAPRPSRIYELVLYDEDIGDTNLLALETYLRDLAGSLSSTHSVVVFGDSMSMGVGSETNAPWHDRISNRSGSRWHNFAGDGQVLYSPHVTATQINSLKGSTEGVVVVWSGTNDIYAGLKTGVETEANLAAFCADLKAGGNKVIVATLPHFSFNDDERIIFNALVKANYSDYADAIVLLDEVPELSDASDTTYFTGDGVHLKDPGHAAAAPLFEAALESITYVGLGDVKPGAVSYWGPRAYSAAAIGADAYCLRRALDDAEQDFETQDDGGLDLAAIASFASSTDLFVRWTYDQIGTNHLGESNTAKQSKFILSGPNGLPAVETIAWTDQGLISAESNALAQPLSFVTYAKNNPAGIYVYMVFEVGSGGLAFGFDNLAAGDTWIGTNAFIFPTVPCAANVYHSLQYVFNDDESDIVVDGEDNFPLDLGDTTGLLGDAPLYVPYHDATPYGAGITFTELALYGEALSSEDKTAINANQQAYWNPPEPEEYAGDGAVTIPLQLAAGSGGAAVAQYAGAGAVSIPMQAASGAATRTVPQSVGTGAVAIPLQAASGTGGAAIPQYAGAGAVTTPLQLASGAAVRTLPVAGTGAVTIPKQLASGAATRTVPQYVGTGAVTIPSQVAAGAATRTVPQYVGTGAVTTPIQIASGAAVRTLPVAGVGAVTIPKQLAAGQGGAAVAQYAGTGAVTTPKQLASGAATRTVPQSVGTGAVTVPKQLASGAATRTVPQYAGAGAALIPKQLASGTATEVGPTRVGTGAAAIPKQVASGVASYAILPRAGDGAIIIPKQLASGAATRTVPQFVADGAVTIPAFIIAGSASTTVIAPRQPTLEGTAGRSEFSSGRRSSMFEENRPQSSASKTRRASKFDPGRRG